MARRLVFFALFGLMASTVQAASVTYEGDSADPGTGDISSGDEAQATWDALGGGWDHVNGSDAWDGTGIGAGRPGGASALTEDATTFLRIQDTGDPRDYGLSDPGSNRKVWFAHQIDFGLDGARLEFRTRIATDAPLDDAHPDGGGGITPWPSSGIGYTIRNDGKGMLGIAEAAVGHIGFSLALQEEIQSIAGYENVDSDVLLVNEYNPGGPGDINTGNTGVGRYVPVNDATAWHDFVVDIASLSGTEYRLSISVDGGLPLDLDVTAGDGIEYENFNILQMGSSDTGGLTAFDVDYFRAVPEPASWSLLCLGALAFRRRRRTA